MVSVCEWGYEHRPIIGKPLAVSVIPIPILLTINAAMPTSKIIMGMNSIIPSKEWLLACIDYNMAMHCSPETHAAFVATHLRRLLQQYTIRKSSASSESSGTKKSAPREKLHQAKAWWTISEMVAEYRRLHKKDAWLPVRKT